MDKNLGHKHWQRHIGAHHHVEGALCYEPALICEPPTSSSGESNVRTADHCSKKSEICSGVVFVASYLGQDVDGELSSGDNDEEEDDQQVPLGRVWALSAATGDVMWHSRRHILGEVKGSPTVLHLCCRNSMSTVINPPVESSVVQLPVVFVGSHDGSLYAFNAVSGTLLNTISLNKGAIFATPVPYGDSAVPLQELHDKLLVATTGGWIMSIAPLLSTTSEGDEINLSWSVTWSHNTLHNAPVFTTPVVFTCPADGAIDQGGEQQYAVCCTVGGECLCLNTRNGKSVWSIRVQSSGPQPKSSPVFSSPCVFPLWRRSRSSSIETQAVSAGSKQLCPSGSSASLRTRKATVDTCKDMGIAFGCHDGILRFVSAQLGVVVWRVDLNGAIFASPTVIPVLKRTESLPDGAHSNVAIVSTTCGELFAVSVPASYDADEKISFTDLKILHRVCLPGEVYSSPVVAIGANINAKRHSGNDTIFVAVGCRDDSVYSFSFQ